MPVSYSAFPRLYGGSSPYFSGYGSSQADQQLAGFENLPMAWRIPGTGMGTGGFGGAWGSPGFGQGGGTTTATGGGASAPGLPLLQTSKSPAGNAALAGLLGQTTALPTGNVQDVVTSTKDPAQATRTASTGSQFDATNAQANQTLADFTKNYLAGDPQAKQFLTQETGAIGNVYGSASDPNSMTATLQRLVSQRNQAVQGSLQRALAQAQRRANLGSLGFGGGDSYTQQQFMDTAAGVLSNEAQQEADLNRQNYLSTLQAQTGLAGSRAGLLNNYLSRNLVPIQAGQQLTTSELANLGALGNITNANRIYQTPEQLLAARLGLVGQYAGNLNALNLFGVGANVGSPAQGWGNPMAGGNPYSQFGPPNPYLGGTGGGGNPGTSLPAAYQQSDPITQAAAMLYFQNAGVWPNQDQSYSADLWQWARNQAMGNPNSNPSAGGGNGILNAMGGFGPPDATNYLATDYAPGQSAGLLPGFGGFNPNYISTDVPPVSISGGYD